MADSETIITISDVLEYLFCPRFIYYMHCLDIRAARRSPVQGDERAGSA